jgi:outer membrane protein OmpA-like peptidoglycan-associated protein
MPLMRACSLAVAVVVCAVVAAVPAAANDIDLRIDSQVATGKEPTLTVVVNKDVESVTVDVSSGKARIKQTLGPQGQPGKLVFTLKQEGTGVLSWKGTLAVVFADGSSGEMPLAFQTERKSAKFKFSITKENLDLANNSLKLVSERSTKKVEIEIYTDEDDLLAASGRDYDPPVPAGQPVEVEWLPKKAGDVLRIHTTVYDEAGSFQSSDSFPYSITIPHEDVVFETGKSTIRAEQEPKLQAVVPEIEKALKRFGPAMKAAGTTVKLFVQGHTDTVGDPGSNRALSQARALAIAKWFRGHGVKVAVYARGFGEDLLKVETPDNTDEERNRRAEYDVGVDGPTGSLSGWTRVD